MTLRHIQYLFKKYDLLLSHKNKTSVKYISSFVSYQNYISIVFPFCYKLVYKWYNPVIIII